MTPVISLRQIFNCHLKAPFSIWKCPCVAARTGIYLFVFYYYCVRCISRVRFFEFECDLIVFLFAWKSVAEFYSEPHEYTTGDRIDALAKKSVPMKIENYQGNWWLLQKPHNRHTHTRTRTHFFVRLFDNRMGDSELEQKMKWKKEKINNSHSFEINGQENNGPNRTTNECCSRNKSKWRWRRRRIFAVTFSLAKVYRVIPNRHAIVRLS